MGKMFKYQEIVEAIIHDVQEMPASTKLPTRKELCARFNCTRTTIDRVIGELIKRGYLNARQGSGTYVAETGYNKPAVIKVWALIVPNVGFSLYSAMLRGVSDIAYENGIGVQLYNTDNDVKKQNEIVRNLIRQNISGFIIVPAVTTEPQHETFLFLSAKNIPFVFCNRSVEGVPNIPLIRFNAFFGGYMATRHLLQKGYKRPAYITHVFNRTFIERMEGYMAAICEHGIELHREHIIHRCERKLPDDQDGLFGYKETRALLKLPEPPDSIFCSSEVVIEGVYKSIQHAGLEVSNDIGIISHDNSSHCWELLPSVTAIDLDGYMIGNKAASVLKIITEGEKILDFNLYVFHPKLIERQSCLGPGKRTM
jgi:DNA-binding LacI/PurR family transcriptional regulator